MPRVGATMPSSNFSRVDLPLPLAPSSDDPLARPDVQVQAVEGRPGGPNRDSRRLEGGTAARRDRRPAASVDGRHEAPPVTPRPATPARRRRRAPWPPSASQSRRAHPIGAVGPDFAREAAGEHGRVHVVAHLEGAAHQVAHGAGDPAALLSAARAAHHAALARQQHAVGRVQEQEDVAVGHRQDQHEDLRRPQRRRLLRTSAHGVVTTISTASDTDHSHPADEEHRSGEPGRGRSQVRRAEGQVEEPRPGHEEDRRHDHDPGEERDAQPDPLDEEAERDAARPRCRKGRRVEQSKPDEPSSARLAATIAVRKPTSLARGSRRWSHRADRACAR